MQKRVLWMITGLIMTLCLSSSGAAASNFMTLEESLGAWNIQTMDYFISPDNGEIVAVVELDGTEYTMLLKQYSMRSPDFRVQLQVEGGAYVEYDPPEPSTYRGYVLGEHASVVSASLIDGQLAAFINLGEGAFWTVEPYSRHDVQAGEGQYIVYRSTDVLPTNLRMLYVEVPESAAEEFDLESLDGQDHESHSNGERSPSFGRSEELTDIAFDTDWEFYHTKMNDDPDAVVTDIEYVLNGMELIYQRDTEICYNVVHIIIRTTSSDPYSGWDAGDLLEQFRAEWNQNQTDIIRDVAHLMTGRSLSGGTIGMSYLSTICTFFWGYGLSETRFSGVYNNRVALTAHEVGHSWDASHCDGDGDCHIMCSMLGGCNGLGTPNFGPAAIIEILNHKSSRWCLDPGCDEVMDITEPDPGIAGEISTISVRGAAAGSSVKFYFNVPAGSWEIPECPGLYLDMDEPKKEVTRTADSEGSASLTMAVPSGMVGRTLRMQAADITTCEKSDEEIFTFE
jgi:hypothetical protein